MLSDFPRRFQFHAWATARLVDALPAAGAEAARSPLAHALVADDVWLRRLQGQSTHGVDLWPDLDAAACRALARRNADGYARYLRQLGDADERVRYTNSTGAAFDTAVGDVLDHVLLHAAHHRGQTSAALRQAGIAPPPVDFVAWVRAGAPSAETG